MEALIPSSLAEILRSASGAAFGIALGSMSFDQAVDLRRRLYLERERQRKAGVDEYDTLSILIRESRRGLGFELCVMHRTKTRSGLSTYHYRQRPLGREEMPFRIAARGRRRRPLLSILDNFRKF